MHTHQSVTFAVSVCCCIALSFLSTVLASFDDFACVTSSRTDEGVQFIAPNLTFVEDGLVREWKIGVGDLTDRTVYLQLWRSMGIGYTRVAEHVYIKTTEGTIDTVSVSMSAMAGDVIGFYSQRGGGRAGRLRLEWVAMPGHTMYGGPQSADRQLPLATIDTLPTTVMSSPLLSVSFDPAVTPSSIPSSGPECLSNFGALSYPCPEAAVIARRQYIAPDMWFECDGTITEWKLWLPTGGDNRVVYLQVWRLGSMGTQYSRVSEVSYTKNNGKRLATVAVSMDVLAGDVVGFYVPDGQLQPLWVAAPMFSLMSTDQPNPTDSVQIAGLAPVASSPLISVSFEPKLTPIPSMMTTLVEEFTSMEQSSSNPESSATSEEPMLTSVASMMASLVQESSSSAVSSVTSEGAPLMGMSDPSTSAVDSTPAVVPTSPTSAGSKSNDSPTAVIIAVVLVLLVVLALLVAVVVVATVLVCCRSKKKRSSHGINGSAGGINGAAYDPDASGAQHENQSATGFLDAQYMSLKAPDVPQLYTQLNTITKPEKTTHPATGSLDAQYTSLNHVPDVPQLYTQLNTTTNPEVYEEVGIPNHGMEDTADTEYI